MHLVELADSWRRHRLRMPGIGEVTFTRECTDHPHPEAVILRAPMNGFHIPYSDSPASIQSTAIAFKPII